MELHIHSCVSDAWRVYRGPEVQGVCVHLQGLTLDQLRHVVVVEGELHHDLWLRVLRDCAADPALARVDVTTRPAPA